MDTKDILIFALVFSVAGIRLYQKYVQKDKNKIASNKKEAKSTSFPSSTKDDYEPYSKH
jgi:hypothetical protein